MDGGQFSRRKECVAFEDWEKRVERICPLPFTLNVGKGTARQLHEEQGGVVLPSGWHSRAEGNFLAGGGGEDASLQEEPGVYDRLEAHMVVKGEKQGKQAATEEETAVVFAAEADGWKAERESIPGVAGGKLPKDGIEQGAGGDAVARAAAFFGRGGNL